MVFGGRGGDGGGGWQIFKSIQKFNLSAFVFWRFTATVKDETLRRDTIEYTKQIVEMLHGMLPKLVDWSVRLETLEYTESFFKVNIIKYCRFKL
jgi:hypothetical protein